VEPDLREQFELAVGDDPGAAPGEMASAAIVEGGRMRRRRRRTAAAGVATGLVAVLAGVSGVQLLTGGAQPEAPAVTIAAAMMPVAAPRCSAKPVDRDATDAVVFLTADITGPQRSALSEALAAGPPRLDTMQFESREDAFHRFRNRWADNPDLLAAVAAEQLPESFRVRLADATQYTTFRTRYAAMAGVEQVLGRRCPANAPVGGTL
jgi:hypothetical protein